MTSSLPRPVLMALLGAVAVGALFMFTRGGGSEETASTPAVAPAVPSTGPTAAGSVAAPTAPSGSPATPGKGGDDARSAQSRTLPAPVEKALDAHKVVVLLFWSPRGIDDRQVKKAVDGLSKHGGKVAIFSDRLKRLGRYTRITAGANVVQTPTLIVTDRKGEARMATGYLDPTTVEQYVVDALRGAP